jgi:hypothetical protein
MTDGRGSMRAGLGDMRDMARLFASDRVEIVFNASWEEKE